MIDPEGVLAIAAPRARGRRVLGARAPQLGESGSLFSPESLGLALRLAGFRMVEWVPPRTLGPRGPSLGIAVARHARSAIPCRGRDRDAAADVPNHAPLPKEP